MDSRGVAAREGHGTDRVPHQRTQVHSRGLLAKYGIGLDYYEYGWLLQDILSVETVRAGGERSMIEGGEALRHFVGSRDSTGFVIRAWITTTRASGDLPVVALFRDAGELGNAIMDLDSGGCRYGAWLF